MEIILLIGAIAALVAVALLVRAIWNSIWFWVAATVATVMLLPLTSGMSTAGLIGLILLRVFLVRRVCKTAVRH